MPRKEGQKRKLLVLLEILARETDEKHPLSVPQLVEKLQEHGVVAERKSVYDDLNTLNNLPDSNIDFRRVVNLRVFFERHCLELTTDADDIAAWQPGDFVIYDGHIAVISDRRNAQGQPYVIHHTGHGAFEEDALTARRILAHFRWTLNEE